MPSCLIGIGRCYVCLGQLDFASFYLRKASEVAPASSEMWTLLGEISNRQSNFDQAIEYFVKASSFKDSEPIMPFSVIPYRL